jgi:Nucleotidyltransferase domain
VSLPPEAAVLLDNFAAALIPVGVVALYAGGSLALGDYRHGISDLDLVAVIDAPLDRSAQKAVSVLGFPIKLHCVYVPLDEVGDVKAKHLTWAHGELFPRALSGIARAELLREGVTVLGPPPAELLPPVGHEELREAVHHELSGYWRPVTRRPWLWLQDVYVDIGLTTLARADATLAEGRLITKSQAITRLLDLDVPSRLVDEIRQRRDGLSVSIGRSARLRRAYVARRHMARGIARLC